MNFGNKWVQRAIVWGALLVLYEIAAIAAGPFYLPRVEQIVTASLEIIRERQFTPVFTSLGNLLLGTALAAVVGIPAGLAMGRSIDRQPRPRHLRSRPVRHTSGGGPAPADHRLRGQPGIPRRGGVPVLRVLRDRLRGHRRAARCRQHCWRPRARSASGGCAPSRGWSCRRRYRTSSSACGSGLANAFGGMITSELWVQTGYRPVLSAFGRNRDLPRSSRW